MQKDLKRQSDTTLAFYDYAYQQNVSTETERLIRKRDVAACAAMLEERSDELKRFLDVIVRKLEEFEAVESSEQQIPKIIWYALRITPCKPDPIRVGCTSSRYGSVLLRSTVDKCPPVAESLHTESIIASGEGCISKFNIFNNRNNNVSPIFSNPNTQVKINLKQPNSKKPHEAIQTKLKRGTKGTTASLTCIILRSRLLTS